MTVRSVNPNQSFLWSIYFQFIISCIYYIYYVNKIPLSYSLGLYFFFGQSASISYYFFIKLFVVVWCLLGAWHGASMVLKLPALLGRYDIQTDQQTSQPSNWQTDWQRSFTFNNISRWEEKRPRDGRSSVWYIHTMGQGEGWIYGLKMNNSGRT